MSVRILILGGEGEEDGVLKRRAGEFLLWGLRQKGVAWEVCNPAESSIPQLQAYDVILCWSYIVHHSPVFLESALNIEKMARQLGIPVINGVKNAAANHSFFMQTWHEHGLQCARCQNFDDFEELALDYPLILRRDGVHRGQDVFLVNNPVEAQRLIDARKKDKAQANLDLAIEYIDTRGADGYYRKYRSYVVGDRILPRHVFFSRHWLVNYEHLVANSDSVEANRMLVEGGEESALEVLKAARLTGSEIVALDYSKDADGRCVFWEANRHFFMIGDKGSTNTKLLEAATGQNDEQRRQSDEELGRAMAELVLERIHNSQ